MSKLSLFINQVRNICTFLHIDITSTLSDIPPLKKMHSINYGKYRLDDMVDQIALIYLTEHPGFSPT